MAELMLDKHLGDFTKVFNNKLRKAFESRKSTGVVPDVAEFEEIKKETVRERFEEIVYEDLSKSQGSTLQELGHHMQVHFGKVPSSFMFNDYVQVTGDEIKDTQARSRKSDERTRAMADWKKKKAEEVKTFIDIVEDLLFDGKERKYITDGNELRIGIGNDIVIKNNHFKRV